MGALIFKKGVTLEPMGLGGALIIAALANVAIHADHDVEVTSGTDGIHSGPTDPHPLGNAVDVHTKTLTPQQKANMLHGTLVYLGALGKSLTQHAGVAEVIEISGGLATGFFFGFLEDLGTDNEHMHTQLRKGVTFRVPQVLRA